MSEVQKSLLAGGTVLFAVGAVIAGVVARDRIDLGVPEAEASSHRMGTMTASREDQQVPELDYYTQMVALLKREYVDDIKDDQKLASGAVRGMITSLGDPNSLFMDADEFAAYRAAQQGKYFGIGAEVVLVLDKPKSGGTDVPDVGTDDGESTSTLPGGIPRLRVVGLTPGGPAEKAGMKVGDTVEWVDDHWVIDTEEFKALQDLRLKVDQHKAKVEDLIKLRKELRSKYDKRILPLKARDRLVEGKDGDVKIEWRGADGVKTATIHKSVSDMHAFSVSGDTIVLPFGPDSPDKLKQAIAGKSEVTIDLRDNVLGDFDSMRNCLAVLAPKGDYGYIVTQKSGLAPKPLHIDSTITQAPKIKLITDKSTRGTAEIFALALSSHNLAKLTGFEMAGSHFVVDTVGLPDGTGYTMVVGEYRVTAPPVKKSKSTSSSKVAVKSTDERDPDSLARAKAVTAKGGGRK